MKCSKCGCGLGSSSDDTIEELRMNGELFENNEGDIACEDCANDEA